jgi:single-strand DNA-binding protein
MEDLNTVVLVCRLTADPELRSLQSGQSVCSMRVAFNTSKKVGDGWEDQGNFVNATVWGSHGETCARYLSKGSRVALKGRLAWRSWESEQGKRSEVSITADRVQFLDPPKEGTPVASQPSHPANAPVDDDVVPF